MTSVLTLGQSLLLFGIVLTELVVAYNPVEAEEDVAGVVGGRATALLVHALLVSPYIFQRPDLLLALLLIHLLLFAGEAAGRLTAHRPTRCLVWAAATTGVAAWTLSRFPLADAPPLIAVPADAAGVAPAALAAAVCLAAAVLVTTRGGTVVVRALLDDLDWPPTAGAAGTATGRETAGSDRTSVAGDGGDEEPAAEEVAAAAETAAAAADAADPHAGRLIGHLERLLVVLLGAYGEFGAIGFVIAAKSIARFEALKYRPFAEYYLTGTLASLTAAAGAVFLVRFLFVGV